MNPVEIIACYKLDRNHTLSTLEILRITITISIYIFILLNIDREREALFVSLRIRELVHISHADAMQSRKKDVPGRAIPNNGMKSTDTAVVYVHVIATLPNWSLLNTLTNTGRADLLWSSSWENNRNQK